MRVPGRLLTLPASHQVTHRRQFQRAGPRRQPTPGTDHPGQFVVSQPAQPRSPCAFGQTGQRWSRPQQIGHPVRRERRSFARDAAAEPSPRDLRSGLRCGREVLLEQRAGQIGQPCLQPIRRGAIWVQAGPGRSSAAGTVNTPARSKAAISASSSASCAAHAAATGSIRRSSASRTGSRSRGEGSAARSGRRQARDQGRGQLARSGAAAPGSGGAAPRDPGVTALRAIAGRGALPSRLLRASASPP